MAIATTPLLDVASWIDMTLDTLNGFCDVLTHLPVSVQLDCYYL